jgi:hypothetical protein
LERSLRRGRADSFATSAFASGGQVVEGVRAAGVLTLLDEPGVGRLHVHDYVTPPPHPTKDTDRAPPRPACTTDGPAVTTPSRKGKSRPCSEPHYTLGCPASEKAFGSDRFALICATTSCKPRIPPSHPPDRQTRTAPLRKARKNGGSAISVLKVLLHKRPCYNRNRARPYRRCLQTGREGRHFNERIYRANPTANFRSTERPKIDRGP